MLLPCPVSQPIFSKMLCPMSISVSISVLPRVAQIMQLAQNKHDFSIIRLNQGINV